MLENNSEIFAQYKKIIYIPWETNSTASIKEVRKMQLLAQEKKAHKAIKCKVGSDGWIELHKLWVNFIISYKLLYFSS